VNAWSFQADVCACCGGDRLRKLGEDVTETLETIPRRWKVIQHVREKFTCRDCEKSAKLRPRSMSSLEAGLAPVSWP